MAKYDVTCGECGGSMEIALFGPMKKREWIIENGTHICDDCRRMQRKKMNDAAVAENRRLGLPELRGSEKQVAWAEKLRFECMSKGLINLKNGLRAHSNNLFRSCSVEQSDLMPIRSTAMGMIDDAFDEMKKDRNASFWIENRDDYSKPLAEIWVGMVCDLIGKKR